ncbi:arylformamidase [Temperatibacter marinus]|uniref:Kynurenine formamidase n=1 Tax=Temperatibacter marinus TaxID=1456591 RepID=A0AA52H9Z8_9PROT|nr:arylformamidase [Temperatibacter marinus]WND03444.1 arylformamidase [Temperatibacter marinus]
MSKPIIDITMTLKPGMPVWPGDSDFSMEWVMRISDDCPVNVSKLTLSPHTGTHMDSCFHYDSKGVSSSEMPLEPYIGKALVVDALHCGDLVTPEHIKDQIPDTIERVLIQTTAEYSSDKWPFGFTALHPDTVEFLATRGCVLIGIDTPSMDPQESKKMPSHQAIAAHKISILESLKLEAVNPGYYELIALPLKLEGCDGSPVRAILRPLDENL